MSTELKILTFNVWGLAFVSKIRAPRFAAVAEYLARSDYDIVCLQEAWIYEEFVGIRDHVKGVLPYSRFFHTGALGSGLAILSRFPFFEAHALPYFLSGNPSEVIAGDWFVNKAAGRVGIAHPTLGEIEVWNSHMHAGGDVPEVRQAHRMGQAWQLATEVRRGAAGGRYVFVTGDLNSQPWSVPIQLLRHYGELSDSFVEMHPHANDAPPVGLTPHDAITRLGMTCDSTLNSWSAGKPIPSTITAQGGKRLDYILYRQPPPSSGKPHIRCVHSDVVLTELVPGEEFSYSDHFGLTSTFMIGKSVDPSTSTADSDECGKRSGTDRPSSSSRGLLYGDDETATQCPPSPGGSAYELSRASSAGAAVGAIRTALGALQECRRNSAVRNRHHLMLTALAIVLTLGLTIGSAWQPKSWIQPIFTLAACVLGAGGATYLYWGFLWGRWEAGLLDEHMAEMELELELRGAHQRGR